ncbi:MAG: hypothetical protein OEZ14_12405 [Acidimicrobiia bacterium]|nr:hypothetical protein [Acidimicrobiia bacterium]MDH5521321.1 hypothetical protein [Acidimicrobiia bacterium]
MTNPHFEVFGTPAEAASVLEFTPVIPRWTDGCELVAVSVFVMDHTMRVLEPAERTLELHYGDFVVSQQATENGRRLAHETPYGRQRRTGTARGLEISIHDLGPPVEEQDPDGREPAVVTWEENGVFCLVASSTWPADELLRVIESMR